MSTNESDTNELSSSSTTVPSSDSHTHVSTPSTHQPSTPCPDINASLASSPTTQEHVEVSTHEATRHHHSTVTFPDGIQHSTTTPYTSCGYGECCDPQNPDYLKCRHLTNDKIDPCVAFDCQSRVSSSTTTTTTTTNPQPSSSSISTHPVCVAINGTYTYSGMEHSMSCT